jgi:hypothetical protein
MEQREVGVKYRYPPYVPLYTSLESWWRAEITMALPVEMPTCWS